MTGKKDDCETINQSNQPDSLTDLSVTDEQADETKGGSTFRLTFNGATTTVLG